MACTLLRHTYSRFFKRTFRRACKKIYVQDRVKKFHILLFMENNFRQVVHS
jgi:hypothetical protein